MVVILWLTRRLLKERLTPRGWLFVVALASTSRTVSYHLCDSQVQLLLAALVLGGYAAQRAGRRGWACTAVSAAGMLKLYPFILLPWFIWSGSGGMRGRCRRLIGVIGFVSAVFAVTGPGLWRDFFRYGMPSIVRWQEAGKTGQFSLAALVANLGYWHSNFHPTPEARTLWWFAGTGAGLAIIAAAYGACLVSRRDLETQFCLLCTAMLIGTVTVQNHYFVFLVFPLTVAAVRVAAETDRWTGYLPDRVGTGLQLRRPTGVAIPVASFVCAPTGQRRAALWTFRVGGFFLAGTTGPAKV